MMALITPPTTSSLTASVTSQIAGKSYHVYERNCDCAAGNKTVLLDGEVKPVDGDVTNCDDYGICFHSSICISHIKLTSLNSKKNK